MDIDVIVFTPSAPVSHIQGHALHIYIMGDATMPWFGPIRPIGCQGTQKVTGGMTTRHDECDGWQDNGNGRHDDGKGQQGDRRNNDGNGRQDDGDGWHNDGKGRHDDCKGQQGERRHDDGDGRHNDGKGQQGDGRHDNAARWQRQAAQRCGTRMATGDTTTARGSTGVTTTRHDDGDRRHDGGDGGMTTAMGGTTTRHDDGKGQQGDRQHNARHDEDASTTTMMG